MIKNDNDYNEKYIQPVLKKIKSHSFADYLDASIIIMVAGLFVAIIFTFLVDFIFDSKIDWKEIGVNTVIVSVCTIGIYLLLRTYAMRKGRKTKAWTEADARLQESGRKIIESNCAKFIPKYCRAWEEERLNGDIEDLLAPVGITLAEFRKYSKLDKSKLAEEYPALSDRQLKFIDKAKRIKRLNFDERYFYVNASGGHRHRSPSSGITSKQLNRISTARIILTTVIVSLLTASLLRDIVIDFSLATVVKCVIKVAVIIVFGAMGMVGGYSFSAVRESSEMNAKSDEIEVFLTWCEENKRTDV